MFFVEFFYVGKANILINIFLLGESNFLKRQSFVREFVSLKFIVLLPLFSIFYEIKI